MHHFEELHPSPGLFICTYVTKYVSVAFASSENGCGYLDDGLDDPVLLALGAFHAIFF